MEDDFAAAEMGPQGYTDDKEAMESTQESPEDSMVNSSLDSTSPRNLFQDSDEEKR